MVDEPLDTLKTLPGTYWDSRTKEVGWTYSELRAEGIRQIQYIDEKFYEACKSGCNVMLCPGHERAITTVSAIAIRTYIRWKNNLTEDDLK